LLTYYLNKKNLILKWVVSIRITIISKIGLSRISIATIALAVVLITAGLAFIIYNQSGRSYKKPQTYTPVQSPTARAQPQATSPAGKISLPSEITLWKQTYADLYSQQACENLYKEFERQYGIRIKTVTLEPSDGNNKMNVALEAGSPSLLPDISNMIGELAIQVRINQGKTEPLDDIYEWLKQN
jgi:ABC-type glycerol-3-phosphate transport system substrate-binding protein